MATTDYDTPRVDISTNDDSLEDLRAVRGEANPASIDGDDSETVPSFALPGTDLLDEDLTVTVLPMQTDEFRCTRCFMVWHRSQQAIGSDSLCRECS